ncbi:helix-turn-helix domain-containing protein [Streptomyces sp. NPDC004609]|uniref:helix-turn-helix domain-containing protein n=1 Tax=Streptomyces sp. NPDC004609 TaxID=3364704 RepID=UPI0036A5D8F5
MVTPRAWPAERGSQQSVCEQHHLHRDSAGYRVRQIGNLLGTDPLRPATSAPPHLAHTALDLLTADDQQPRGDDELVPAERGNRIRSSLVSRTRNRRFALRRAPARPGDTCLCSGLPRPPTGLSALRAGETPTKRRCRAGALTAPGGGGQSTSQYVPPTRNARRQGEEAARCEPWCRPISAGPRPRSRRMSRSRCADRARSSSTSRAAG